MMRASLLQLSKLSDMAMTLYERDLAEDDIAMKEIALAPSRRIASDYLENLFSLHRSLCGGPGHVRCGIIVHCPRTAGCQSEGERKAGKLPSSAEP